MSDAVRLHYEKHPYPNYSLLASVRRCDTYALNLTALWTRFNGELPPAAAEGILIAGCGSFAPYPFAVSNPTIPITALDLSEANLKRAKKHCLLHGIRNVDFCQGDLLDLQTAKGQYGFIDSYGVIHHMPDPLQALVSLKSRLSDNGIIRIMVYSRYARREEESIRHAFRRIGIKTTADAKRLIKRAKAGSRLKSYIEASFEARSNSGLADALLHPVVKSYKIDEFMELVTLSGLQVLLFTHNGALKNVSAEKERIRKLESVKESPGNFVAYLGLNTKGPCLTKNNTLLQLNPCLCKSISKAGFSDLVIPPRIGLDNPVITRSERLKLRNFIKPVRSEELKDDEISAADVYRKALFLLQYKSDN
jgi:2-polyprenyl-3-methyl-5-hydroxy-6-metoxy-1,4-benzoquinol methylase